MPKYNPIFKPNQIVCGEGDIVIVTGWTPSSAIAAKLDRSQYAAIGQLYSPMRGIAILLRNLLANPHVRTIVLLDATPEDKNAGAVQCLKDFFHNGFIDGGDNWKILSSVDGVIDFGIPKEALAQIRAGVSCFYCDSRDRLLECVKDVGVGEELEPSFERMREPQIFPTVEVQSPTSPQTMPHTWGWRS